MPAHGGTLALAILWPTAMKEVTVVRSFGWVRIAAVPRHLPGKNRLPGTALEGMPWRITAAPLADWALLTKTDGADACFAA